MRAWCICGFFFQAEDGIRDLYVTGVQTCALPIFAVAAAFAAPAVARDNNPVPVARSTVMTPNTIEIPRNTLITRSEERRVGKECRTGRPPKHETKKRERLNIQVRDAAKSRRWER